MFHCGLYRRCHPLGSVAYKAKINAKSERLIRKAERKGPARAGTSLGKEGSRTVETGRGPARPSCHADWMAETVRCRQLSRALRPIGP
jgi:hypothetical protein